MSNFWHLSLYLFYIQHILLHSHNFMPEKFVLLILLCSQYIKILSNEAFSQDYFGMMHTCLMTVWSKTREMNKYRNHTMRRACNISACFFRKKTTILVCNYGLSLLYAHNMPKRIGNCKLLSSVCHIMAVAQVLEMSQPSPGSHAMQ